MLDWVKDYRVKFIMDFEDLTVGEKRFFCLWDQFMLDRGYIGSVARVHITSLLDRFVEEIGREVMEGKLYRQFVLHLLQLEREAEAPTVIAVAAAGDDDKTNATTEASAGDDDSADGQTEGQRTTPGLQKQPHQHPDSAPAALQAAQAVEASSDADATMKTV